MKEKMRTFIGKILSVFRKKKTSEKECPWHGCGCPMPRESYERILQDE